MPAVSAFTLAIDLCKVFKTQSYLLQFNVVGLILVPNLRNITKIRVTLIENSTGTLCNPTDSSTIDTISNYICILTFKEL